jgi:hypothetical protein
LGDAVIVRLPDGQAVAVQQVPEVQQVPVGQQAVEPQQTVPQQELTQQGTTSALLCRMDGGVGQHGMASGQITAGEG